MDSEHTSPTWITGLIMGQGFDKSENTVMNNCCRTKLKSRIVIFFHVFFYFDKTKILGCFSRHDDVHVCHFYGEGDHLRETVMDERIPSVWF